MQAFPWRLSAAREDRAQDQGLTESGWLTARVKATPQDIAAALASQGLEICPPLPGSEQLFDAAARMIAIEPDLLELVVAEVQDVHLLAAAPGYDVSHTEPQWAARIFVSQPDRSDAIGALRLAESVVHEAMHLHLTLFERELALVADAGGAVYSPWRNTPRPYGGVLHGLFVFTCLRAFLDKLAPTLAGKSRAHVDGRIADIRVEVETISLVSLCQGLTPDGTRLAASWKALAAV
jgi:HEXXH motif-containing protein